MYYYKAHFLYNYMYVAFEWLNGAILTDEKLHDRSNQTLGMFLTTFRHVIFYRFYIASQTFCNKAPLAERATVHILFKRERQ